MNLPPQRPVDGDHAAGGVTMTMPAAMLILLGRPGLAIDTVAKSGRGYPWIFGLLAIEFLLGHSDEFAVFAQSSSGFLIAALRHYTAFAVGPAVLTFSLAVVVYYASRVVTRLRADSPSKPGAAQQLDLDAIAALLTLGYTPHTVLVALASIAVFDSPWNSFGWSGLAIGLFAPSAVVSIVAIRRAATGVQPSGHAERGWIAAGSAVLTLVVVATALVSSGLDTARRWESLSPVAIGQPIPAVTLTGFDGSDLRIEELRGKVVLFDFWASWCAPCRTTLPIFHTWAERFAPETFAWVSVNVHDTPNSARRLLEELAIDMPSYADHVGLSESLGIDALPTTLVVDAQGRLRHRIGGVPNWIQLEENIRDLIENSQ